MHILILQCSIINILVRLPTCDVIFQVYSELVMNTTWRAFSIALSHAPSWRGSGCLRGILIKSSYPWSQGNLQRRLHKYRYVISQSDHNTSPNYRTYRRERRTHYSKESYNVLGRGSWPSVLSHALYSNYHIC